MRIKRLIPALLLLLACAVTLVACGDDSDGGEGGAPASGPGAIKRDTANAKTTITVGSKNFTEQKVLGEIYAQGLQAAGYRVDTELNLGDEQVAQRAIQDGVIDAYPEYTGTALLSLCGVPSSKVPKDPAQAFEDVQACFDEDDLMVYPPTPFTSSNEIGVKQAVAQRYDLQQISDLVEVDEEFTLYGTPECRGRSDCLRGFRRTYGLRVRFVPVNIDLRHEVLDRGDQVASVVFTTDPQNKRQDIVLLEDDKGMFPPNNSTFVVRDEVAEKAGPDLPEVIQQVQRGLTDQVMQELNARVDLDRETPEDVARDYLQQAGLVAAS